MNISNPQHTRTEDVERLVGVREVDMALTLFDQIECGLIVSDEEGYIRFANHAAQQELASQRVLHRDGGKLHSIAGGSDGLRNAIRRAAADGRRNLVRLRGAGGELIVSVAPLQVGQYDHALVILGRRQPCSDLGLELLATSYGLTLAERKVLRALMLRSTPCEIANAHGVKLSTIRTQILSIRSKFGSRSIEDLMLQAAQLPPMTGALRQTGAALPHAASLQAA